MTCSEFVSSTNDTHYLSWNVEDEIVTVKLPPFAGDNVQSLKAEVETFLENSSSVVLDYILEDVDEELVSSTLRGAIRFAEKSHSQTIKLALSIRCASFCSQGWGSITGAESLGIETTNFN